MSDAGLWQSLYLLIAFACGTMFGGFLFRTSARASQEGDIEQPNFLDD
jgi:hypothetical protein